ncbi:hypothetical protein GPL21_05805 [Bradyrhizobium pachyrhizi]|uniref:Uncharacterized protein n=1 Tax=Bradyrhizobium pachyrhizi TaxID=280333 RepID=A0A844SKN5_9BRAD|nr:hypothetical protein [Bradyrhizobium pachyrhizi]MVT64629.1 hypothetical protein [Bradyrhizobium pachyrhizi]
MTGLHLSKQIDLLDKNACTEAERLRKEARGTPPGVERDRLIRQARQAEAACRVTQWLASRELEPPR